MENKVYGYLWAAIAMAIASCAAVAGSVDVTTLGVKNDGSEDVSAIVNRATEKHTLFFPEGRYLVAHPLKLKNPIRGDGYMRCPKKESGGTWLISAINAADENCGVIEYAGNRPINIEKLNIKCSGRECGILMPNIETSNTLISKVGIYDVCGTGIFVRNRVSRKFFCEDITIFSKREHVEGNRGMFIAGVTDSRLSNIEIMGLQVSLEVHDGHVYGNNMHLWTGCMSGKDDGKWWYGTRALLLGNNVIFHASEIYPDTSYHAIEMRGSGISCSLYNIMYWEDGTCKGTPHRDGSFVATSDPANRLTIQGGLVEVGGWDKSEGWMRNVYPNGTAKVSEVLLKCDYEIKAENFDRLNFNTSLPDYEVGCGTNRTFHVADIMTLAPTGFCEGRIELEDGAAWRVTVEKAGDGRVEKTATPLNRLCGDREVTFAEKRDQVVIGVRRSETKPMQARFRTLSMGTRFRPIDYDSLRTHAGKFRY